MIRLICLLLIAHVVTITGTKMMMTNEISMPFDRKQSADVVEVSPMIDEVPTIVLWNKSKSSKYRSNRFERLREKPIDPVFVRPAVIEKEKPLERVEGEKPIESFYPIPPRSLSIETSTSISATQANSLEPDVEETTTVKPKKNRRRRKHKKLQKLNNLSTYKAENRIYMEKISEETNKFDLNPKKDTTTQATSERSVEDKMGESYLGGWNEEPSTKMTTKLSTTTTPPIHQENLDVRPIVKEVEEDPVKKYYQQYYEEWYRKHNEAELAAEAATEAPKKIKIQLGEKPTEINPSPINVQPNYAEMNNQNPTIEQLEKICKYVQSVTKQFGIKDIVNFAKNNCALIRGIQPQASCDQVQKVMEYCTISWSIQQQQNQS